MEPVIWAYAYGRPKESIDLRVGPIEEDLSLLSLEELTLRAEDMLQKLRETRELVAAIPAEILAEEGITVSTLSSAVDAEKPAEVSSLVAEGAVNPAESSHELSGR
jgi:hypothetical protein